MTLENSSEMVNLPQKRDEHKKKDETTTKSFSLANNTSNAMPVHPQMTTNIGWKNVAEHGMLPGGCLCNKDISGVKVSLGKFTGILGVPGSKAKKKNIEKGKSNVYVYLLYVYIYIWSPPPRGDSSSWGGDHHTR